MAAAGYPLLGDGKYGKLDKQYDRKIQALYSYKLTFRFTTDSGSLAYLNGKTFQVENVSFVSEYFTLQTPPLYNKFRQNFSRFLLTKEGVPYMMSIGTSAFLWMY